MGGHAIKDAVRLSAVDYHALCGSLSSSLNDYNGRIIKAYRDKESFGDMDILFPSALDALRFQKALTTFYGYTVNQVVRNVPVTSIGVELPQGVFQMDLIVVPDVKWASTYFDLNDMGNLMGRIAHKLGFKYGHDGLWYVLRDPDNHDYVIEELLVTSSLSDAFHLIGYSYGKYLTTEFNTLEDIFLYVIDNQYFDPDIYLLDNRNHIQRTRDRKRHTYMQFLAYCSSEQLSRKNIWTPEYKQQMRQEKLEQAFTICPAFKERYDHAVKEHALNKQMKLFWNGDNVSTWTGLTGKQLGQFMAYFKDSLDQLHPTHFRQWVLVPNAEQYKIDTIKRVAKEWRAKNEETTNTSSTES